MDENPAEQVINELFPYFEALETRSLAILQFLKEKGLTTDEEFARYLEQAANGSNVKWLAARVRVERLLSSALKEHKDEGVGKTEQTVGKTEETKTEPAAEKKTAESSEKKGTEKSDAKDSQPKTEDRAENPVERPTRNSAENDAGKPDKTTTQKAGGSDGPDKRGKDVSAKSAVNERAKESAEKKEK